MKRMLVVIFVLLVALPVMMANAQDEVSFPDETFGVIVQSAKSGAFSDNGDGTYTLTLEEVDEFTPVFFASPSLITTRYETSVLSTDWNEDTGEDKLFGVARLELGSMLDGMSVAMELTAVDYDYENHVFTYVATITDMTFFDPDVKDADKVLPDSFDDATLFIIIDKAFADGLQAGRTQFRITHREVGTSTCWLTTCPGDAGAVCDLGDDAETCCDPATSDVECCDPQVTECCELGTAICQVAGS